MTATAYARLRERVLASIASAEAGATSDPVTTRRMIEDETEHFQRELMRNALPGYSPFSNPADIIERLLGELQGVGSELDEILAQPTVEEVYGRDSELTVRLIDGDARMCDCPIPAEATLAVVQRLVSGAGETLDAAHPKVDGIRVSLPDGRQARLSASVPPRVDGTVSFVLRVPTRRHTSLSGLVKAGSLSPEAATFLEVVMRARRSRVLVAGPPNAGKTTVIEALLRAAPSGRRVICAEEHRELSAPLLNGDYWQTSKVETLADIIRSARVASPELIVLGELKGPEAWELLMAGTLGIGLVAAVHAEDTAGAFESLAICATKAVPATPLAELERRFATVFDVVVYCDMDEPGGKTLRQITEIAVVPPQVTLHTGGVAATPIFKRKDVGSVMELNTTALGERFERRCNRALAPYGLTISNVLEGQRVSW